MSDDLEGQIRAAIDLHSGGGDGGGTSEAGETAGAEVSGVSSGAESGGGEASADAAEAGSADGIGRASGRTRDATGRFARGKAAASTGAPKAGQASAPVAPAPGVGTTTQAPAPGTQASTPAPKYKAPQSWKPELREKWGGLPPELQEEIDRRERDHAKNLQEMAQVRQWHQQLQQTISPYQAMLRARGQNPVEAIGSALQTVYALESAPQHLRAREAAKLIRTLGVDIEALDAALAGEEQPAQHGGQSQLDPQAIVQQAKQELMAELEQRRAAAAQQSIAQEIQEFAQASEFFEDVRPMVAALMRGPNPIDLKAAYEQACWASPEVRKILMQREAATQAKASIASTQRSRAAASSLKNHQTAPAEPRTGDDLESQIRAAMKQHR
jgi:hypothetical protein